MKYLSVLSFFLLSIFPVLAKNQDTTQYEPLNEEEGGISKIEVRLGSLLPLGNLSEIFSFAPSLSIFLGIPVRQNTTVDIGFMLAVPADQHSFDFTYQDEVFDTKANMLADFSLRYRYQHRLNKQLSCTPYFGAGVSFLQTDLLKGENREGEKTYHEITMPSFCGGVNFKYKKIGCFVEYHRTMFSLSSKVANNFGNSFLNIGVLYGF